MRSSARLLVSIAFLASIVLVIHARAQGSPVFGPKDYVRTSGPPQVITDGFSVADTSLSYKLVLTNNGLTDSATESAADSFIYLNDNPIVGANNFNQSVGSLEIPITLLADNKLEVEVRGVEGGSITLEIVANP